MGEYEAIFKRRSVRKYQDEEIAFALLEEIKELAKYPNKLFDIDFDIHVVEDGSKMQNVLKGLIGSYGKIIAPHYLVVTSEKREGYLENVGYALEDLVLKMTEMGLGTCYIGGFYDKNKVQEVIEVKDGHETVIVLAFGYPSKGIDYIKMLVGAKRLGIDEFCDGDFDEQWKYVMDAVRVAPSAMNSQPWRFIKYNNIVDVYIKTNKKSQHIKDMNKIDIGIALQHLKVAAEYFKLSVDFKRLDKEDKDDLTYILSILEG
ncbi:dihydropteridine reductase [Caloramator mitchellensis]|uniref:Dihydropteridine reductase n=1 Tax=Caloramator mitchellensis TaxID=908809 RepID=A0A0R3K2V3_CALMK|nr:nitroreductase family protein [Caloramator mitchellensis]KRQ87660.1 dihydropteridine reductase [Caloramator mitchellensis]